MLNFNVLLFWYCGIFTRIQKIVVRPFLKKHKHFMLWHSGRSHTWFEVKLCNLVVDL